MHLKPNGEVNTIDISKVYVFKGDANLFLLL